MQNIFNAVTDSAKKFLCAVGHSSVYRNNLKQPLFSRLFIKKLVSDVADSTKTKVLGNNSPKHKP